MKPTAILLASICVISLAGCSHSQVQDVGCVKKIRALMDVGSGSTKLNLSEVAVCGSDVRVLQVLDDQTNVALPLEGGKSADSFSAGALDRAVDTLRGLRDQALITVRAKAPAYKAVDFAAVGTHALRTARNGAELSERVKALGFSIRPLSQQKEGESGYLGAKQKGISEICKDKAPVIWDVGGGSMQFTTESASSTRELQVQGLSVGAESFKKRLLGDAQNGRPRKTCDLNQPSPNPIGWKNSSRAEHSAETLAGLNLEPNFQSRIAGRCIVGIGGVHEKAIEAQIQRQWPRIKGCACGTNTACTHTDSAYTKKELQCLALYLSEKSDCDPELKGPYSSTAVSNAYLILGFMEYLKIDQVRVMNVSMGNFLVLDASLLEWSSVPILTSENAKP